MQKSEEPSSLETLKDTTHVNFVCQRCFHPLRLDPSLYSLDEETQKDLQSGLVSPDTPTDNTPKDTNHNNAPILNSNIIAKIISPAKTTSLNGSGFTLVGIGTKDPPGSVGANNLLLSHRLDVSAKLFDLMSGKAEVDHPLCEECTDSLLDQLDEQLHITEKELESYKELLLTLESRNVLDDTELDAELEQLQLEEKKLVEELSKVEKEYDGILKEREEMKGVNKTIDKEEEVYWREYCDHQKAILDFEDEKASVHNYLHYAQTQLDKLRKTNVFNSTFHIWHKGHFGTINNFRLGRLPSVPVEWTEINAAWGQTVLLLQSLAKKIGLVFKRYRLVPYGNHSFVECLDDKTKELPLYGSGGFRFFWDTKFDHSMVAFLDCLQQFKEEVEKGDSKFYLPYRMDKGKIYDSSGSGAYSVKIQFNSEEHWTKALKFMLTNLKWGLAWVSSQFADKHS